MRLFEGFNTAGRLGDERLRKSLPAATELCHQQGKPHDCGRRRSEAESRLRHFSGSVRTANTISAAGRRMRLPIFRRRAGCTTLMPAILCRIRFRVSYRGVHSFTRGRLLRRISRMGRTSGRRPSIATWARCMRRIRGRFPTGGCSITGCGGRSTRRFQSGRSGLRAF